MIITIDGPAGSGKSTASRGLAKQLGIAYLDTGATYRAVTWKAMELGIDLKDPHALAEVARKMLIEQIPNHDAIRVLVDGQDVSKDIRTQDVTNNTRYAAASPEVREVLVELQRQIGKQLGSFVTEGRDQGTVVFPDADLKIYLNASCEERASRRTEELRQAGEDADYETVLKDIEERDQQDRNREVGPLVKPQDAVVVNTSGRTIEEVQQQLVQLAKERT